MIVFFSLFFPTLDEIGDTGDGPVLSGRMAGVC